MAKSNVINPAKYRHQITIRHAPTDASRNSFGQRTGQGDVLATIWAEKQDWVGQETSEYERETSSVVTRFVIRYREDVAPNMTLEHGQDEYDIYGVMDMRGDKKETTLMCRKVE